MISIMTTWNEWLKQYGENNYFGRRGLKADCVLEVDQEIKCIVFCVNNFVTIHDYPICPNFS